MSQKYMEQYIGLSRKFTAANKSQETIEALYDFVKELEKEQNDDNEIILSHVYTLLGYHKKAYDLYKKVYEENETKAKAKLFELHQMAQEYGDNFPIKAEKNQSC
jgi:lipopolysaccharide biosynthesis regulator YciM